MVAEAAVVLVGRLGSRVTQRELPSGDTATVFTIVVDRPPRAHPTGSRVRVDAIPCQAFRLTVARRLSTLEPGQWVRAEGRLRRRFWRSAGGLGSALEVEVITLKRCR
jgi:single-strand DNA-binding protein